MALAGLLHGVGSGNARVFDLGSSDITYLALLLSRDTTRVDAAAVRALARA